jgi:hypothetical protein
MPDLDAARQWLELLEKESDDDRLRQMLCALPALLRPDIRESLRASYGEGSSLRQTLDRADAMAEAVLEGRKPYAVGGGPIEVLATRVERNEVSLDAALLLVQQDWIADAMVPIYVEVLAQYAVELQPGDDRSRRQAIRLGRLLRAAVDNAAESSEKDANLDVVESAWVEIAIRSLGDVPDRRLLEDAEATGRRVVERTRGTSNSEEHGLALMRLGVLYFDPFVKYRDLANYSASYQRWHEAFVREYGASADQLSPEVWHMPPLEEALQKAVRYLTQASEARTGRARGQSLKALAEALWVTAIVEKRSDLESRVEETARRALELLDPKQDAHHIVTLESVLRRVRASGTSPYQLDPSALSPAERVAFVFERAKQPIAKSPLNALESLREARELFDLHATSGQRSGRLQQMAELLRPAFAPREDVAAWGHTWNECLSALQAKSNAGTLAGRELAVCAVELAVRSTGKNVDREGEALPLIGLARAADARLAVEYDEVFRYLTFVLQQGAGVSTFRRGDHESALTAYLEAFGAALSLRFPDSAQENIELANDVLRRRPDLDIPGSVPSVLASHWLPGEDVLGESGSLQLTEFARRVDRSEAARAGARLGQTWQLWQVAKGLRFASSLGAGRDGAGPSAEEMELLADIRQLEDALGPENTSWPSPDLERPELVSYLRPASTLKGFDKVVRLANLQHEFDAVRRTRLASLHAARPLLGLDEARGLIDPGTAIVNLFLSLAPDGALAVRWSCVHREGACEGQVLQHLPPSPLIRENDGFELVQHPIGPVVIRLRTSIRIDPGFDPVSEDGARDLDIWESRFLGDLLDSMADSKGPIRHLCIVPHGPLHFLPFHLLGPVSSPLVDRAVVTYLPNLGLLGRRRTRPGDGMLALGIGFQRFNPRGKAPLTNAVEEAAEVAALFETEALPEESATPGLLLHELPRHRYVHIATHGEQNPMAPAFHHLNLVPGTGGEDRLFAYELDGLDLSGVDLVTLSACETALGRVDPSDNIRGMAAALFRAGVRTVIGTLWPTGTATCGTFFTSFYRALRAGQPKREAFADAQGETRKKHPTYRAWGSFYLMGDWN